MGRSSMGSRRREPLGWSYFKENVENQHFYFKEIVTLLYFYFKENVKFIIFYFKENVIDIKIYINKIITFKIM